MSETGPDKAFFDYLRQGRFMLQRAVSDGRYVFYPRAVAPGDGAALEWIEASGLGRVYSTTVVRKKPPEPSYNVALIDLAEGPRMMSRVEGIAPEAVAIGMAVKARIDASGEEPVVVFTPAEAP
ncbi:MAG: OB-fold domain-containing protein [Hyphomonadaceae bacterium]|nr:OB-fold domain-containing protein [Hyphomonadaceae bacterium]